MADLVPSDEIEAIVGAPRDAVLHLGRFDSDDRTVYVMHGQHCLDRRPDLLRCPYSRSLDMVLVERWWRDLLDQPVVLTLWWGWRGARLRPFPLGDDRG